MHVAAGQDAGAEHAAPPRVLLIDCYAEMRRTARAMIRGEGDLSFQPTDLAHEAAIRLMGLDRIDVNGHGHMLALSARVMRQTLIDEIRRARAAKRQAPNSLTEWPGGGRRQIELDILDDALRALAQVSADHAEIVELRFSLGLTVEEAAAATGITTRTVKRRWQAARAWLQRYLETDGLETDGAVAHA
ncbi:ECF-type sigma factor [Sphingomonas colocasiae]|uniref:Sigma-70 family RNA polymerase sigma factor n=1 Tax=Sphingomonas colocasiae TaxID=1848973 RepID=A0ABS7PRC4_9SPHN|nr:ECF-type sigma factor [Sphingomonas colocasiae]MBY8823806.1 sigma-70 family RNA polymerase sigma factor [Sphingomonas colocasiae]